MEQARLVIREVIEYHRKCQTCGNDFQLVDGYDSRRECYNCENKRKKEAQEKAVLFMYGARIVKVDALDDDSLSSIVVETNDGRRIEFTAGGYDRCG